MVAFVFGSIRRYGPRLGRRGYGDGGDGMRVKRVIRATLGGFKVVIQESIPLLEKERTEARCQGLTPLLTFVNLDSGFRCSVWGLVSGVGVYLRPVITVLVHE
jgi:hypothetical protein